MTDKEVESLLKRFDDRDKDIFATLSKYEKHPAVFYSTVYPFINERREVFKVIFSDMSDEEKYRQLDIILPPGTHVL